MERKTRFELATFSLARRCSTAELLPPAMDIEFSWWGRRDSNSHALRHMILSHARLPVPTLPRLARSLTTEILPNAFTHVKDNFSERRATVSLRQLTPARHPPSGIVRVHPLAPAAPVPAR